MEPKGLHQWKKNTPGRQIGRASATSYGETLWSELFPGSTHSAPCLLPAVAAVESAFDLAPGADRSREAFDLAAARRRRTLWRLDGGFGTDLNLLWLLARNYQVLAKGFAGRRAENLSHQVQRWTPYGDVWLGRVPPPIDYGRWVQVWVKRRLEKERFKHSYYLTTLKVHSITQAMTLYNQRGAAEVEQFRTDKQGLHLSSRRKQGFGAQKALILLTDLAHNLLADFHHTALVATPFQGYAAKRIVRDLLAIEGNLLWEAGRLKRIELHQAHPNAQACLDCLVRYCKTG